MSLKEDLDQLELQIELKNAGRSIFDKQAMPLGSRAVDRDRPSRTPSTHYENLAQRGD